MARGELMKKLLASYGQEDAFRAVAEQIIGEEEKKKNNVLARTLRKTLEKILGTAFRPKGLPLSSPFPMKPVSLFSALSQTGLRKTS